MNKILQRINTYREKLTENDFDILAYLIRHPEIIQDHPIKYISKRTLSSESTLVRLAQKLGFSGFSEFRYFLKDDENTNESYRMKITSNIDLLYKDIQKTMDLITNTNFTRISQAIHSSKKIYVFGTGWGENNAASDLLRNFMAHGVFMTQFPSITELRWNKDKITSEDLLMIISFSGENTELLEIVTEISFRQVNICSITPLQQSTLSNIANFNLFYHYSDLNIVKSSKEDYNLFVTLYIVTDALFRNYIDQYQTGIC